MKKLMLSVSIATALALTGCGDGSDSPASNNTDNTDNTGNTGANIGSDINAKFFSYDLESFVQARDGFWFNPMAVSKITTTVEAGIAYEKKDYLLKNKLFVINNDYQKRSAKYAEFPYYSSRDAVILTQAALYEQDNTVTPLGVRLAFVEQLDDKGAVYVPYSLSKDRSLKYTVGREKIDLSGKRMGDFLFLAEGFTPARTGPVPPASTELIDSIQYGSMAFPQGSMCWRELTSMPNKDALAFQSFKYDDVARADLTLEKYLKEPIPKELHREYNEYNWAGIPWGKFDYLFEETYFSKSHIMDRYAVQYKGKSYYADRYVGNKYYLNLPSDLVSAEAELLEIQAKGGNTRPIQRIVNILKNSCDYYNQVAADSIDAALANVVVK